MTIRLATLQDIQLIMQLINEVLPIMQATGNLQWDNTYPNPEVFTADVENSQLWVADIDGAVAGVIAICTGQEPEYGQVPGWDVTEPAIVAHRLAVSPHMQGKGIANALLNQCEVVANEKQIPLIRLDTNIINRPMQNLFLKIGYNLGGEIALVKRPGMRFLAFEKRIEL
ncbi:GNAT family N-acetyltransferase [Mucilaginibacter terrae]|uniref:N-acetylglutamate synthase-like GNAT family acetyltransferase n=1 Tax=Mucilaginibacter terrae TaxID=1955052 RepID=A0ABU3GZD1_9SPHI|nr:GNAT family N-acetyltransferase [Mucilaginibacter terrae]MDT3405118.1 N-acetylglutamate synthase-like GNAT family acetyltransferase [Mucilaginibacter terrae]